MLPSNAPEFETVEHGPAKKGRPQLGGLVVTVVLALALIVVIAVAISRLSGGGLTSRPSAATAPTAASQSAPAGSAAQSAAAAASSGAPADTTTQAAIQQVIQQVDAAQIQAVQTNNPQVMAATATPEFYQEQVTNNQDLVDSGVTDIKLVNMEWGPITIDGNNATATVWETWSTTFDDGTTEQARDRNVYQLVLDNGAWKVKADLHPDQPTPTASPGAAP